MAEVVVVLGILLFFVICAVVANSNSDQAPQRSSLRDLVGTPTLIEWQKQYDDSFPSTVCEFPEEDDEVSRQKAIGKVKLGEQIHIASDLEHPTRLIAIRHNLKDALGYLPEEVSPRITALMESGGHVDAVATQVTGADGSRRGVDIMLGIYSPETVRRLNEEAAPNVRFKTVDLQEYLKEQRLAKRDHRRHTTAPEEPIDAGTQAWMEKWQKCLHANISGVSFDSNSGIPRQELILRCRAGDELLLVRDPENPYDSNAILIFREGGTDDIGHVPKEIARILSPQMERGAIASARITKITGLAKDGRPSFLGVNIVIGQNHVPRKKREKKVPEDADVYGS